MCYRDGRRYDFRESAPDIFTHRDDAALVIEGFETLMRMPSAGDLVIYGVHAREGHVSFLPEQSVHAGPSRNEMHTFILHPAKVAVPVPIHHPVQLYDHFIRYRDARSDGAG